MKGIIVRLGDTVAVSVDAICGMQGYDVDTPDAHTTVLLAHGHRVTVPGATVDDVLARIRDAVTNRPGVRLPGATT